MAFDAGRHPAAARATVGPLPAGGASTASATLTLPATLATGTYYLIAQADGGGAIAELNEINNGRAVGIRVGPDLVVSAFTAPTRAAAGGTIAVTDTTANSGSGAARRLDHGVLSLANITLEPGDVRLGAVEPVPALAAGQCSMATTTVTLPDVASGAWYLLAAADDAGGVTRDAWRRTTSDSPASWSGPI